MQEERIKLIKDLFSRFSPSERGTPSNEHNIAIVGGGPAGLLLGWKLLDAGHRVSIFEKRESYQLNSGPDKRSYNLTADGLGLRAFGRLSKLIYLGGTFVDGRAIHPPSPSHALWTHLYGRRASDHLVSIARGDLLAVLACTISEHSKCMLRFNCKVTDADLTKGSLTISESNGLRKELEGFDLVAFADGVQGLGQNLARKQGHDMNIEAPPTAYLTATVTRESADEAELDLTKIHFFPCVESVGIGLPNHDGSISVLIEGKVFRDRSNQPVCPFTGRTPFKFTEPVFLEFAEAERYLDEQNPLLSSVLRGSLADIIGKRPQHFTQSNVSNWQLDRVGVLVGDAGSSAPPWAGFGMNLACSHADDLARLVVAHPGNLGNALEEYSNRRIKCTEIVQSIIEKHGALLTSGMALQKWRREEMLRDRREQILDERSDYQTVAFDDRGLEILAGLE